MSDYPKYLMKSKLPEDANWSYQYLPLWQAGALYDSGWQMVDIGDTVLLDEKGNLRPMTKDDERAISDAADRYSESK